MNKKGFTLIELIVVITIIAILSAFIFMAFQGYIGRAKGTQDTINEKFYNEHLNFYLIEHPIDKTRICASDIRDIISNQIGNEIVFETNNEDNHYWFDTRDNSIVIDTVENIKELREEQPTTWALSSKPESIYYPFLLLDNKGDSLVNLVMMFYDETNYDDFNSIISKLKNIDDQEYFYNVLKLNSFIGKDNLYNYDDTNKQNIIVANNVTSIKDHIFNGTNFERLYFPGHIQSIDITSFNDTVNLKLISFNSYINNILINNFNNSGVNLIDGVIINGYQYIYGTNEQLHYFDIGDGSEENPFEIENATQFKAMSYYHNKHFKLMNDLDLTNITIEQPFDNIIDGQGCKVILNNLFETINNNAVVKNLVVEHNDITLTCNNDLIYGGLVNYNHGLIQNVKVNGNLTVNCSYNNLYIGGVAAYNDGTIDKTINNLNMDITINSNIYLGGIVGHNEGIVSLVANDGVLRVGGSNINVGGLIGYHNGSSNLNGLLNRAKLYFKTGTTGSVGGFIGTVNTDVTIENSAIYSYDNIIPNHENIKYAQGVGNIIKGNSVKFSNVGYRDFLYVLLSRDPYTHEYLVKSNNLNKYISHLSERTDIFKAEEGILRFYFE